MNNFDTTFQWVDFTISLRVRGTTSTSLTTRILTLGRTPTNFEGELAFSIVNKKLQFWDHGTSAEGYGFADGITGTGSISSGTRTVFPSFFLPLVINDSCLGVTTDIAFVKQGTTGKFYINGQFDKKITSSRLISYTKQYLCYGGDYRDSDLYFTGTFSGLVIYKQALTSNDILDIYYDVFQIPSAAPICKFTIIF